MASSTTPTTSVAVFLSTVVLVLLCGGVVHQSMAAQCTCPPHYFDAYTSTASKPQIVANGLQSQLFMMGNARSEFLPPHSPVPAYTFENEPAFRLALNLLAAMYELIMTASTDLPPLDGGMVANDVLRDLLNTLATDACDWINETIPNSGITCDVPSLLHLHQKLSSHETTVTARDGAQSHIPPTGSAGGLATTSKDRCAWVNHRIFDDCRSTCTIAGATAQDETVIYYDGKFGCSQLRDSLEHSPGDYALCSNANVVNY